MLKLIVSTTEVSSKMPPLSVPPDNTPFAAEIEVKGPYLYLMTAQDPSHYLSCDLILEVNESQEKYNGGTIICHFPKIEDEQLNDFLDEDDTLYEIIMGQFQMKILEQLFLFCATHYASTLVIYTDDAEADSLRIYKDFLIYENQPLAQNDDQTEIIIPAHPQTFDDWVDFMDQTTLKFRQALWQGQRANPIIKQYLKIHPLG